MTITTKQRGSNPTAYGDKLAAAAMPAFPLGQQS
jgi:hypothetical protein